MDMCWIKREPKFNKECLVKWKQLPIEDATQENMVELEHRFPNMDFGDKVPTQGEGIDKPRCVVVVSGIFFDRVVLDL